MVIATGITAITPLTHPIPVRSSDLENAAAATTLRKIRALAFC
jgi:hypothetical protein